MDDPSATVILVQRRGAQKGLDDNRKRTFTAVKVNPHIFDAYVGEYQLSDGTTFTISKERSRLLVQQSGYPKIDLFARSSVRFFAKAIDVELTFVTRGDDEVTAMEIYQDGQTLPAKKVK